MNKILFEISSRFSPLAFSSVKPTNDSLQRMLEAARWAPSSYNEQPWHFLLAGKGSEKYAIIRTSLTEYNQIWTDSAPILGVVLGRTVLSHNGNSNNYYMYDVGAAMSLFTIQALNEGYQIHQMGGYDSIQLEKSLQVPENVKSVVVFALGVPADDMRLPADMQQRARAERIRKPLEAISEIVL